MKTPVDLYTDGACSGNPGPGGWAAILIAGGVEKEISGYEPQTTNNRMELFAAIAGLRSLNRPCDVSLYSDSAYLVSAFNQGWIDNWQRNGWQNKAGKEVSNQDLWLMLLDAMRGHKVRFIKVKGHADNMWNNRCDKMAVDEIRRNSA